MNTTYRRWRPVVAVTLIAAIAIPVLAQQSGSTSSSQQNRSYNQQSQSDWQQTGQGSSSQSSRQSQQSQSQSLQQNSRQLQQRLQQRLQGARNIQVDFSQGTLTLKGTVQSQQQKQQAEQLASNLRGVNQVKNELTVQTGGRSDQGFQQTSTRSTSRWGQTDQDSQRSRQGGFQQTSQWERDRQWDQDQQRLYRPQTRAAGQDSPLARRVKSQVQRSNISGAENILITEKEGKTVVFGRVDSQREKAQIERLIQQVSGVQDIDNRIIVSETPERKSNQQLSEDVQQQLRWSWFVDADDINVDARNGTVTLSGSVEDFSELNDAIYNAFQGGAQKVVADLSIGEDVVAGAQRDEYQFEDDMDYRFTGDRGIYGGGRFETDQEQQYGQDRYDGYSFAEDQYDIDVDYGRDTDYQPYDQRQSDRQRYDQQQFDRQRYDQQYGQRAFDQRQYDRQQQGFQQVSLQQGLRIEQQAQSRLQSRLQSRQVFADFKNGTLFLYGYIQDQQQKQQAEQAARNLQGVRNVRNFLQVQGRQQGGSQQQTDWQSQQDRQDQWGQDQWQQDQSGQQQYDQGRYNQSQFRRQPGQSSFDQQQFDATRSGSRQFDQQRQSGQEQYQRSRQQQTGQDWEY